MHGTNENFESAPSTRRVPLLDFDFDDEPTEVTPRHLLPDMAEEPS